MTSKVSEQIKKTGLSDETVIKMNTVFHRHSLIEKVILYGSRAKGNFKRGSDIDLTIVAPKMELTELLKIANELDDLLLPYKIDLSLYHQIDDPDVLEHIRIVGLSFFEQSK